MLENTPRRAGVTLAEVLATLLALLILLVVALPSLARTRGFDDANVSLANLVQHGVGHATYAGDWNGRQFTTVPDDFAAYGASVGSAVHNYFDANPGYLALQLGWDDVDGFLALWAFWVDIGCCIDFCCGNRRMLVPMDFETIFGRFRVPNAYPLHEYLDGRFYGSMHYAPGDEAPLLLAAPGLANPYAFIGSSELDGLSWSSYCLSAAALYSPDVFRAPSAGGWQEPFQLDDGLAVPPLAAAAYPDLKTLMLEHNWVRGDPSPCHPKLPYDYGYGDCSPWQYNHGIDAEPAALFYDGSARLLPNAEVQASDQMVLAGTGGVDGLWSRDTPLGSMGYRNDLALDATVNVSHHVLTTGGILGRDTLGPLMTGLSLPPLDPRPVSPWSALHPGRGSSPITPDLEDAPWSP